VAIMMIIGTPTLFILYFFAWKYRETNPNVEHSDEVHRSRLLTFMMWAIPSVCVAVLAVVMWGATHRLDPKKPIYTDKKPLVVQVVALRWKWLFLYPEQKIASVNFLQVPTDTPLQFELTADEAPMNSFWIPHWGGQLYA